MPTLTDLNETSEWVAHMLRVLARESNFLVKRTGVESLFEDRKGALDVITGSFSAAHLILRSLPDMVLRSRKGTELVEAKAGDSGTPNIAVELFQLLMFRQFATAAADVWYCIGRPDADGNLTGWMCRAKDLEPCAIHLPDRLWDKWPPPERQALIKRTERAFPACEVTRRHNTRGSCDPYVLVAKSDLDWQPSIADWLKERTGGLKFGVREKEGWEGKKQAQAKWRHYTRQEWGRHDSRNREGRESPGQG